MHCMRRVALALLLLGPLPRAILDAQERVRERWQITLEHDEYLWDVRLVHLTGDTLVFRQADTLGVVTLGRIQELRLLQATEVRLDAGASAAVIGALMGTDDEVFDLTALDFAERLRAVRQIFLLHPSQDATGRRP